MAIDLPTVQSLLTSSGGTIYDIADTLGVSATELRRFLSENGLKEPCAADAAFSHQWRMLGVRSASDNGDFELLLYDDPDKKVVNGLDDRQRSQLANGMSTDTGDILKAYHGPQPKCMLTNEPFDIVVPMDGSPMNFLISNLAPFCKAAAIDRLQDSVTLERDFSVRFRARVDDDPAANDVHVHITATFKAPVDKATGELFQARAIPALLDQWIASPFAINETSEDAAKPLTKVMPEGIPPTAEAVAFWAWRQISCCALLKGLRKIVATVVVVHEESTVAHATIDAPTIHGRIMQIIGKKQAGIQVAGGMPGSQPNQAILQRLQNQRLPGRR